MKITLLFTAAAAMLTAAPALAQTTHNDTTGQTTHSATAGQAGSHNPAIKDRDPAKVSASAKGANSFTEDQAMRRLTEAGYTGVTGLAKDRNGVWRGTATKGGKTTKVGLDFKGNVTTR